MTTMREGPANDMSEHAGEKSWNQRVIEEFRTNDGRVGGRFAGATLVLLTTTGRRSGNRHTTPLMCRREGGRLFVFGSAAGRDQHPAWFLNLEADDTVHVEIGDDAFDGRATVLDRAERDEIWERHTAEYPGFADYQRQTDRVIPVVELTLSDATP